jgi:hypothetical protein
LGTGFDVIPDIKKLGANLTLMIGLNMQTSERTHLFINYEINGYNQMICTGFGYRLRD